MKIPQRPWVLALVVFAVNLLLKALFLGAQDIALDEPFTLFWAQRPVGDILELAKNENNPPLHFLIEHIWIRFFGIGPFSVRFPSLIFSSLCAATVFHVGQRHFGWVAGVGASLLFTFSTEQIYYSHEARTYALLSLLVALSIGSFLQIMDEPRRIRPYLLLGIWNILLIYSHFLGIWVLLIQAACVLAVQERRVLIPRFLVLYLAILLAYAPNLYALLIRLRSVAATPTWVPKPHWTQLYGHVNIFWNGKWATIACIVVVIIGLVLTFRNGGKGQFAGDRRQLRKALILGAMFAGIYLGIYIQSLVFTPAFIPRYLSWVSVPFFMAVAALFTLLFADVRWRMAGFGLIVAAMLPGFKLNPGNDRAVKPMVEFVRQSMQPGTILIIAPDYFDKTYLYHADLPLFQDYLHWQEKFAAKGIFPVNGFSSLPTQALAAAQRVVLIDADIQSVYPQNGILDGLKADFQVKQDQNFEKAMRAYVLER
ncbi:MAG: glycosyltransferase family 39 protein [Bacteroidia bacterium]|nr:glycosyltransferase family 39 protein [Bacteroidia bacterium]